MTDPPRIAKGTWQIGPLAGVYGRRSPSARLAYFDGCDLRTGSPVCIILMLPPWDRDPAMRREMLHGIGQLRQLDHPSIARVLDVLDEDDLCGYVTEAISGSSVYHLLFTESVIFTEAEVVRVLSAVADGLRHAHSRGVVFANLKPTNIRIESNGAVKCYALPKEPHQFQSFLATAWYLGHAVYHSPEFLRCEPLDERTDVYGLGVTAYEMMVSRMPHRASGNLGRDLAAIVEGEWPAPADLVEGIDPNLNKIIIRCLRKDRAARYGSAEQLLRALQGVKGKPRALISAERLQEIVTTAFPSPVAALARSLAREDHLTTQKDKLLNQINGLLGYLGFLAAHSLQAPLADRLLRPSLGHWTGLISEALNSNSAGWPFSDFRGLIANRSEFLDCLARLVQRRNEVSHAATPQEGAVLHDWVRETSGLIRQLYRNLLFLTRYALVSVEDMDYVGGVFRYTVRRLEGAGTPLAPFQVSLPQPYGRGKVYFTSADFSRLVCLEPFVMLASCPLCGQTELFFYTSTHERERRYVTPDRGHTWSCSV
jgi:serine/threonine protein kinase